MICPRCSVAEISSETGRCELCGYALLGTQGVAVQAPVADEVHETVQRELSDRFELQVLVHRDRGSTLYLARDVEDDRLVSLRLLTRQGPVEGPLIHRFAQTATLAGQFRHPHLVPVRKHGITNSLLWYSMDAVKSRTLSGVLAKAERLPLAKTLELLEQVASGLEYLHRNAVVHGGVGRETVLVDNEGWTRVSDPGIAAAIYRAAGPGTGWEATLDLPFAPPELIERRLMGPAADQYSLGVVAYTCLAGRPPSEAASVEELRRERARAIPPLREVVPDVPAYVDTAVQRALRDDPAERFGSVLDLVAVMSSATVRGSGAMLMPSARPTGASVVVVPEGQRDARRWRRAFAALATVAVLALGVAGLVQVTGNREAGWAEGPVQPARPSAAQTAPAPVPARDEPPVRQPSSVADPAPREPTPTVPAAPLATLFVNATPWGSLYVDGRLVGNTPQANLRLPAGVHTLRIVRDGFVAWEQEVRLEGGETVRLTDIVLRPLQP